MLRISLIAGACLCFVIGAKWIAEDIVYHVTLDAIPVVFNILAFVPLVALAPRYKSGFVYLFIGIVEVLVIIMGCVNTLR